MLVLVWMSHIEKITGAKNNPLSESKYLEAMHVVQSKVLDH